MATILNAGTTTATSLQISPDTSGVMVFETGGVTAMSISSSQVVSFTNTITGTIANATNATNATQITNSGGWNITPSGTKLYISYNGTNVASIDSSGNFKSLLTVTAGATP